MKLKPQMTLQIQPTRNRMEDTSWKMATQTLTSIRLEQSMLSR